MIRETWSTQQFSRCIFRRKTNATLGQKINAIPTEVWHRLVSGHLQIQGWWIPRPPLRGPNVIYVAFRKCNIEESRDLVILREKCVTTKSKGISSPCVDKVVADNTTASANAPHLHIYVCIYIYIYIYIHIICVGKHSAFLARVFSSTLSLRRVYPTKFARQEQYLWFL